MKKTLIAFSVVVAGVAAASASDDPVATRKALMQNNGAAAAVSGAMMKGDLPYHPLLAKAAFSSLNATATALGDYFPEGSDMDPNTTAAPNIWEDKAAFDAEIEKFQNAISMAMAASGKDGPADVDAFKAAIGPVFGSCKSCHESFRVEN